MRSPAPLHSDRMVRTHLLAVLLATAFSISAHAQTTVQVGGRPHIPGNDTLSTRNYWVEFVEPPLFESLRQPGVAAVPDYRIRFDTFEADLAQALPEVSRRKIRTGARFHRLFTGMQVTADSIALLVIRSLPYVKAVHPDREYHTMERGVASRTGQRIRVDGTPSGRGAGVRVAILDSGVDYLHPDLAGIGGYDFVDGDADPMDLNGHGTHVAGIVRDIAPEAALYAVRVLNDRGRGLVSDILAGIEHALDPNGDGDPTDRFHIVNMSLGSDYGLPTDPTSVAVQNASAWGVLFVVAAGNAGAPFPVEGQIPGYFTDASSSVGSPAVAPAALAVGAITNDGRLAPFSGKGPVGLTFAIKPEITAPGVDIISTLPGGTYGRKSGTSMAAPHVAGMAAVLRSEHPEWEGPALKSALVQGALSLGAVPLMHQGNGQVDLIRARATTTHVVPAVLSFGMNRSLGATWTASLPFTLHNGSPAAVSYQISVSGNTGAYQVHISETAFGLDPGETKTLTATVSVNQAALPNPLADIRTLEGSVVVARSTGDPIRIPWAFSRATVLRMRHGAPYQYQLGLSDEAYFTSGPYHLYNTYVPVSATEAEAYGLAPGSYLMATVYPDAGEGPAVVVHTGFELPLQGAEWEAGPEEARHTVEFAATDTEGRALADYTDQSQQVLALFPEGAWLNIFNRNRGGRIRLSDLSAGTQVLAQHSAYEPGLQPRYTTYQFPVREGVWGDIRYGNPPGDPVSVQLRHRVPAGSATATLLIRPYLMKSTDAGDTEYGATHHLAEVPVTEGATSLRVTMGARNHETWFQSVSVDRVQEERPEYYRILMEGPDLTRVGGRIVPSLPVTASGMLLSYGQGDTIRLGHTPVSPLLRTANGYFGNRSAQFEFGIRGQNREWYFGDEMAGTWKYVDPEGAVLHSGNLRDIRPMLELPDGRNRLEAEFTGHVVVEQVAGTRARVEFDNRNPNRDAPFIGSVYLTDGAGRPAERFAADAPVVVRFTARRLPFPGTEPSYVDAGRTRVWFRRFGSDEPWTEAPVSVSTPAQPFLEGQIFTADLSAATRLGDTGISVRILATEPGGNLTEFIYEPMFGVGGWKKTTRSPDDPDNGIPSHAELVGAYPNPFNPTTVIRYRLPAFGRARVVVYDLMGREVAVLADGYLPAGTHSVSFEAVGLASGIYMVRLVTEAGTSVRKVTLLK